VDILSAIVLLALFGLVAFAAGFESRTGFSASETWEHHL
jgi:hypothetical protein